MQEASGHEYPAARLLALAERWSCLTRDRRALVQQELEGSTGWLRIAIALAVFGSRRNGEESGGPHCEDSTSVNAALRELLAVRAVVRPRRRRAA